MKKNETKVLMSWPTWPAFTKKEVRAVSKVVKSNQLFAAEEVKEFENNFSQYLGSKYGVGIGNATQGLHLALSALNVGEGDEVIVTNCSWISSASCILMQNAIPIFVDIEPNTFGLDPELLESAITFRTKAIIAVHILGYPAQIEKIKTIAVKYGLPVIEDASHAPGAELNGKKLGTFGDIGVFSLQQRKAISTGDGGIAVTDNAQFAEVMRKQRSFGDSQLSYNYRMSEFAAVLGQIGLGKLDAENSHREKCALFLYNYFKNENWIKIRISKPFHKGVYYAVAIDLNISNEKSIEIVRYFSELKVPLKKLFGPLNLHPHFSNFPIPARGLPWLSANYTGVMKNLNYKDLLFPVTSEYCNGRILELYTHPGTTENHLEKFASSLTEIYKKISTKNERELWQNS